MKQTIIIFLEGETPTFVFLFYAKDYLAYKKKIPVSVPQCYLRRPYCKISNKSIQSLSVYFYELLQSVYYCV